MPRPKRTEDGLTKFQRCRQRQQHRGMKQLRIWVPDPHKPEFAAEPDGRVCGCAAAPKNPKHWISLPPLLNGRNREARGSRHNLGTGRPWKTLPSGHHPIRRTQCR
ncbi:hypothetical protein MPLB_2420014 [Mesorhizobium sp. ORS 3324]|nr:hypothetical protein MPLB_2420014 [Mesorhizobium sp. ORS 3324]